MSNCELSVVLGPTLSIAGNAVLESAGSPVLNVTLSAVSASTVTVDYASANGTATAGSDYIAAMGTLSYMPGQTSKTIQVTVTNEATIEANETFTVTLSNPSNAGMTTGTATGTINDDDGWSDVEIGWDHGCARRATGELYCWGDNTLGQVGDATSGTDRQSPVLVAWEGATNWAAVAGGAYHSCATRSDGQLWCWGDDDYGQLGNAGGGNSTSPAQESTGATDWASVSVDNVHACAVKTTGTLWCWATTPMASSGWGQATRHQRSRRRRFLSTAFHKYGGIRTPMHPRERRCTPCAISLDMTRSCALLARRLGALGASPYLWNAVLSARR